MMKPPKYTHQTIVLPQEIRLVREWSYASHKYEYWIKGEGGWLLMVDASLATPLWTFTVEQRGLKDKEWTDV
jgi:hypothetical protein